MMKPLSLIVGIVCCGFIYIHKDINYITDTDNIEYK